MVDGTGTTAYTYHPAGQLGAGQVASVDGPLSADTITYGYDELGRVSSRANNGVAMTHGYDPLGRVTSEMNLLRTLTYAYPRATNRSARVPWQDARTTDYQH